MKSSRLNDGKLFVQNQQAIRYRWLRVTAILSAVRSFRSYDEIRVELFSFVKNFSVNNYQFHFVNSFGQNVCCVLKEGRSIRIWFVEKRWTVCVRTIFLLVHFNQSFVELQARRTFAAGVTRGKNDLKLKNPAQTPVSNLIENAVIEVASLVLLLFIEQNRWKFCSFFQDLQQSTGVESVPRRKSSSFHDQNSQRSLHVQKGLRTLFYLLVATVSIVVSWRSR